MTRLTLLTTIRRVPTPQTESEFFSLAARLELSENSRLGFGSKVTAQEPGLLFANLQSTLGMHVSLPENRGRSRIQTWNRYAYVANNPLSNVDPLGLVANCPQCGRPPDPPWWMWLAYQGWTGTGPAQSFFCMLIGGCNFGNGGDSGGGGTGGVSNTQTNPDPGPPVLKRTPSTCDTALATAGKDRNSLTNALSNWTTIDVASSANGIDPSILAAVGIRETGFQNITGDHGHGHGVFQIDDRTYPIQSATIAYNIPLAASFAAGLIGSRYSSYLGAGYDSSMAMAGAIRAYNAGGITAKTPTFMNTGWIGYLDLGTSPGHPNYVTSVLTIASECF